VDITDAHVAYSSRVFLDDQFRAASYPTGRAELLSKGPSSSPLYTLYSASFSLESQDSVFMDISVTAGGKTYKDATKSMNSLASCS
jgi:hypothetical protein